MLALFDWRNEMNKNVLKCICMVILMIVLVLGFAKLEKVLMVNNSTITNIE